MSGQANFRVIDEKEAYRGLRAYENEQRLKRLRIDTWLEIAIVVLTMAALWLLTSPGPESRYGHWIGLASQPFWIAQSWRDRRWGMFFFAFVMFAFWCRGIAHAFF